MKWEYKVVDLNKAKRSFWTGKAVPKEIEGKLNDMGALGWELVGVHVSKRGGALLLAAEHLSIFKRRKS